MIDDMFSKFYILVFSLFYRIYAWPGQIWNCKLHSDSAKVKVITLVAKATLELPSEYLYWKLLFRTKIGAIW